MTFKTHLNILLNLQQVTSRVKVFAVQLLDSTRALVQDLRSAFPEPRGPAPRSPAPNAYPQTHTLPQLAAPAPGPHDRPPNGAGFRGGPLGPNGAPAPESSLLQAILLVLSVLLLRFDHFARSRIVLLLPVLLTLINNSIMVLASKAVVVQALLGVLLLQPPAMTAADAGCPRSG